MQTGTISRYAALADQRERDPIIIPGEHGRADVANGRMTAWLRCNQAELLVGILDAEGRQVWLTPKQHKVHVATMRLANTGQRVTMHKIADLIGVNVSTVSRAMVKFAAWGLIAYQANRGRYGGTIIVLRSANDTLSWFRDAAKAKVRLWARRTAERVLRMRMNVAARYPDRVSDLTPTAIRVGRNIQTAWTPDELREAGII